MKILKGPKLHESDYANIREQLQAIFYKIIFKPIVDLLAPHNAQVKTAAKEFRNAVTAPVVAGIRSGKIQYTDGVFSGDFNSTISKALKSYGAIWNKQTKTFKIQPQQLPIEVLKAVNEYADAAKNLHDELYKRLDEIQGDLEQSVKKNPVDAKLTISKVSKKFNDTYQDALNTEGLSEEGKKRLAKEYSESISPYVQKFSEEMILELRSMVKENAETGYRFDNLVDRIQGRFVVSKSRAELIARTETGILVSKAHQEQFAEAGIDSYIWQTAGDSRVREDHRHLNGREFYYDDPPIIDEATGETGNPGETYNCRCVADPVLPGTSTLAPKQKVLQRA